MNHYPRDQGKYKVEEHFDLTHVAKYPYQVTDSVGNTTTEHANYCYSTDALGTLTLNVSDHIATGGDFTLKVAECSSSTK